MRNRTANKKAKRRLRRIVKEASWFCLWDNKPDALYRKLHRATRYRVRKRRALLANGEPF